MWNFLDVGIMDLNGNIIDNNGLKYTVNPDIIFKKLEETGKYISDVVIDGNKQLNQLTVVVPIYDNSKIIGAFLGRYPCLLYTSDAADEPRHV